MKNIETKIITLLDNTETEYIFITNEDDSITSMPKIVYNEMIAAQSTPIDTEDE
jgi:hypothetical protein